MNVTQALSSGLQYSIEADPKTFTAEAYGPKEFQGVFEPTVDSLFVQIDGMRPKRSAQLHTSVFSSFVPRVGRRITMTGGEAWVVSQFTKGPSAWSLTLISANE